MMRGLAITSGALALVLSMTPAIAEPEADYGARDLKKGDAETMRDARPFADCLVAEKAKEIPKYLGSMLPSIEWLARDMRKSHPNCPAPKNLGRDSTMFVQTALLEALIRRDFGSMPPPANFNDVPPLLYVKTTDSDVLKEYFVNLIEPYDCVSRREPARVQAFLATKPMSAEENAAFEGLRPTIVACQPKGESWELRAYFVRRFVAETYYTLMKINQRNNASVH